MQEKNICEAKKRLQEWLEMKKLSIKDISLLVCCDYSRMWSLVKGKASPTLAQAVEIDSVTNGFVIPKMWLRKHLQDQKPKITNRSKPQQKKKHSKDIR